MSLRKNSKSTLGNTDRKVTGSDPAEPESPRLNDEDPLYRHALHEAKIILSIWLLALLFTCTYCYLYGYTSHPSQPTPWGPSIDQWVGPLQSFDRDPTLLSTPGGFGIPEWVLVGIVIPWFLCILATLWFCLFVFHHDDLGESCEEMTGPDETCSEREAWHD